MNILFSYFVLSRLFSILLTQWILIFSPLQIIIIIIIWEKKKKKVDSTLIQLTKGCFFLSFFVWFCVFFTLPTYKSEEKEKDAFDKRRKKHLPGSSFSFFPNFAKFLLLLLLPLLLVTSRKCTFTSDASFIVSLVFFSFRINFNFGYSLCVVTLVILLFSLWTSEGLHWSQMKFLT